MKRLASALQLAGLCALTIGSTLAWVPLGVIVGGASTLLVGVALEVGRKPAGES